MDKNKPHTLEEKVDQLFEILGGTVDGEGLIHVVKKLVKDVYDAETGTQKRIEKLESEKAFAKAWLVGAGVTGGAAVWIIEKLIQ